MNKSFKRIVACMLMLCLLLCAAVPAAIAADTTDPIVYQFYVSEYSSSANSLKARATEIATRYSNGFNWKYEIATNTVQNSVYGSGAANLAMFDPGSESLQLRTNQGDWVAFRVRVPEAGVYSLSLNYAQHIYGAYPASMHIIPANESAMTVNQIETALSGTHWSNSTIDYYYDAGSNSDAVKKGFTTSLGNWECANDGEYILVFKADTKGNNYARMFLGALVAKKMVASITVGENTTYYETADAVAAAINATESGTAKLLSNITFDAAITLKSDVTLDLNGKTLTANVKGSGTVTDSSVGSTGKIVGESAVQNVGENEIALYDGTATRIVGYTLVADDEAAVDDAGTTATFWYTFKFDNAEAYRMIAAADNNAGFNVGATLAFNGNPVPVSLKDGTVSGWAGEMAKNPDAGYAFYVAVTGFENLDESVTGSLDVKLTVNGSAGSAESAVINYTID